MLAVAVAVTAALAGPAAPAAPPAFGFTAERLPPAIKAQITGSSWHRGCPVGRRDLRYVRVSHRTWSGGTRTGELIVHRDAVPAMRIAFGRLYRAHFPIRRLRLVDAYGASDSASIDADNTSAFNCRRVTGGSSWSEHAYGRAIDVNPIENPYVFADGTTTHPASEPYLDRTRHRRGMAFRGGKLVRAFRHAGWKWGASFRDFQHFSATGH